MRWGKEPPEVEKHRGAEGCAVARARVVHIMPEQGYAPTLDPVAKLEQIKGWYISLIKT